VAIDFHRQLVLAYNFAILRIPTVVMVVVILILFPRHFVAERLGYTAMRCVLYATVLIPIVWAILLSMKH
jgi:uncharacterized membrane protein YqjE